MTLITHTDSDGHKFDVWAQRQANSCAVASIWMARGLVRQTTFREGEWDLAWRTYHQAVAGGAWKNPFLSPGPAPAPQTFDPGMFASGHHAFANTFASTGIGARHVASMLMQEGLSVGHVIGKGTPLPVDFTRLAYNKPAIVCVGWFRKDHAGKWVRDGGHAIVAARKNSSGQIVYLDPFGGKLVETDNNGFYSRNGAILEILYVSG